MVKNLRSLIHEKFDFELRVELELLSRRRDISNKEKQEELINILRKHNIDDIVPLGSGTNRYAFKISGFVVKFATDNDGKIDNLKEFKMAKRLYPHVIIVHEVSGNGTMLVTEYIQPFDSPMEMYEHQEEIRRILTEMSSTYLIGDVGISEKNYANWGLRIGTNQPVCLDFAYVYEIRSDLFICQYCMTNSMIVPNRDFSKLHCSNPRCGREYLFEDIRRKIGNDIHRHEIGDLGEEGYLMTDSHIVTELTTSRSNYLLKKKEGKKEIIPDKESPTQEEPEKSFIVPSKSITYTEGEDTSMINEARIERLIKDINKDTRVQEDTSKRVPGTGFEVSKPLISQPTVAFVHDIVNHNQHENHDQDKIINSNVDIPTVRVIQKPISHKTEEIVSRSVVQDEVKPIELPNIENLRPSISKISNIIKDYLREKNVFHQVANNIQKGKLTHDDFYTRTQNCIYNTLLDYTGIQKDKDNIIILPEISKDTPCLSTLYFFERVYTDRRVSFERLPIPLMTNYRSIYNDHDGIQRDWIPLFKDRMSKKVYIDSDGIDIVASIIEEFWCSEDIHVDTVLDDHEEDESSHQINNVPITFVIQRPENEDDDEDEEESENSVEMLTVDITNDGNFDIVTIIYPGRVSGYIAIPFYTNLKDLNPPTDESSPNYIPSMADDRNGDWDWLIHFQPDIIFTTKDPDKYLEGNSDPEVTYIKCLIMDEDQGTYVVGVYYIDPNLDLEDYVLQGINYLVKTEIATSSISHLRRSLQMTDLFRDEEYILKNLTSTDFDDIQTDSNINNDSSDTYKDDEIEDLDEASAAAISSIKGLNNNIGPGEDDLLLEESDIDDLGDFNDIISDMNNIIADIDIDEDDIDPDDDTTIISTNNDEDDNDHDFVFTPRTKKKYPVDRDIEPDKKIGEMEIDRKREQRERERGR